MFGKPFQNKGGDNMDKTLFSVVRFDASDTFAREVKSMTENGYDLLKVVDTPGYECLEGMALLVKSNHTFTEGQLEEIVCLFTQLPVHLETLIEG
jgi:aspartyl-tRNA synthetase